MHRRLEPQYALAGRLEDEEARLGGVDGAEHLADAAVIMHRQVDAEEDDDDEDERVLDGGVPRHAVHAGDHDVDRHRRRADPDRQSRRDRAVGGDRDDDAEALELQHQIGHQRHDADRGDEHAQPWAVVFVGEEVRLRQQALALGVAPDRRQQPVGHEIGERAVGEDVVGRRAAAVGPAAAAEEGEGGVDLAGGQQEHQQPAEAAAGDRPLLEGHAHAAMRGEPERQRAERRPGR